MSLISQSTSNSWTSGLVPERKYDVFISFRGTDTRFGFLSHLLKALREKKIHTFVDYELRGGDEISQALFTAIEKSEVSLVVFSEGFASSSWCLKELAHIIGCKENHQQIVVPIFHEVDPSDVRYQKRSYAEAFDKHRARIDQCQLQKWRNALKKVSDLSGFHSSNFKTEAELIEKVVKCVLTRLNQKRDPDDLKGLVGLHKQIADLETLLRTHPQDVFVIGIWGMGGIGKTTIAEKLFERLRYEYEGSYFLRVKKELKDMDIIQLKAKLLAKLLDEDIDNVLHNGILSYAVERRLSRKKVLLVLDDITDSDHLETLVREYKCFGPGSVIIVTSRDKHVLIKVCNNIHEVKPLNTEEAIQLFNLNAFPKDCLQKKQEYSELSNKVVKYVNGVPLAIRVLGRSLYDKNRDEWESKLKKIEEVPDVKIQNILEWSFNELDHDQKGIFLFLACYFKEESKEWIAMLLDACGYHSNDGLRVLQDRALITISVEGYVFMHNLIQKMGRGIVLKESPNNPGQRSHLWNHNDIHKVFENSMGTQTILSIRLNMLSLKRDLRLGREAFVGMDNVKFLQFESNLPSKNRCTVYPPRKGFKALPNELRYFHWDCYPLKSLPLRSCMHNLVELNFTLSSLQRLWDGTQDLPNLNFVNLSYSSELIELPDLSKAPNLKGLYLEGCDRLSHLGIIKSDQTKLSGTVLQSLQFLDLRWCPNLIEVPDNIGHCLPSLRRLTLSYTNVESLPESIGYLSQLRYLGIENCQRLQSIPLLPSSIEVLHATNCVSLKKLGCSFYSKPHVCQPLEDPLFMLYNCVSLDEQAKDSVARCYVNITKGILSASKCNYPYLCFPGEEVPECFGRCFWSLGCNSFSVDLKNLGSDLMGFIFIYVVGGKPASHFPEIKCHIEASYDDGKVLLSRKAPHLLSLDLLQEHVIFWHDSSFNSQILEEVQRFKKTFDQCPMLHFQILNAGVVINWGLCPIYSSWSFPPPQRRIKLNTAGALQTSSGEAGCGGILIGDGDEWIHGFAKSLRCCDATEAKLYGVLEGLNLAWSLNFRRIILECDFVTLAVNGLCSMSRMCRMVFRDICSMLRRDWNVIICRPRGIGNLYANCLAKYGNLGCETHFSQPPPQLSHAFLATSYHYNYNKRRVHRESFSDDTRINHWNTQHQLLVVRENDQIIGKSGRKKITVKMHQR